MRLPDASVAGFVKIGRRPPQVKVAHRPAESRTCERSVSIDCCSGGGGVGWEVFLLWRKPSAAMLEGSRGGTVGRAANDVRENREWATT